MEDVPVVILWFVIMGVVAVAKLVKRKGDAQEEQEEQQEQQAYRPSLAPQQQQAGREQRHQPEEQLHSQYQLRERVEQRQGQQRKPVSQDGKHDDARKLIENAIERQSSAARKHTETQSAPHPEDQKIPLVTRSIATPKASVATADRKGQLRRMLSSKRNILNAIILREVLDRPRAYDV
jgi:hypothetical protein